MIMNCTIWMFIFHQVYSTLNLSKYHVTDISVESLTYHDDDIITVAVIVAVDREPMVDSLKSSLTVKLKHLSLDVVNTLDDVEVTGYLPSRKLSCTGRVLRYSLLICIFLPLQSTVSVMVELKQMQ